MPMTGCRVQLVVPPRSTTWGNPSPPNPHWEGEEGVLILFLLTFKSEEMIDHTASFWRKKPFHSGALAAWQHCWKKATLTHGEPSKRKLLTALKGGLPCLEHTCPKTEQ